MNYLALPTGFSIGPVTITFYAIFILIGALCALGLSELRVKGKGYNPHDIENLFLVAFPVGLVGARIWYCVFQPQDMWAGNFWKTLAACIGFVDGKFEGLAGLAIQGGVIFGVVSGMMFVKKYRPHMKLMDIADACVPTILVAQAIGRWGNFMNQEVYGKAANASNWQFMGQWFIDQMTIDGQFRTPLFLIEGIINLVGFCILVFVLDKLFKKYMKPGVITFSYFIYYGIVRLILEPLRDEAFIMQVNNNGIPTSRITAIVFIAVGVIFVSAIYINALVLAPKGKNFGVGVKKYSSWFDSFSRKTKIILEAIPVTGWLNAILYRFSKDNFCAAIFAVIFGPVFWIIDLISVIEHDKLTYYADGPKMPVKLQPVEEEKKEEKKDEQ